MAGLTGWLYALEVAGGLRSAEEVDEACAGDDKDLHGDAFGASGCFETFGGIQGLCGVCVSYGYQFHYQ